MYYLDLFLLRDPQDRLPLALPYNNYPRGEVNAKVIKYDDGMQTYAYIIPSDTKEGVYVKHIFTGNLTQFQETPNTLLEQVQLNLEIVRKSNDNSA